MLLSAVSKSAVRELRVGLGVGTEYRYRHAKMYLYMHAKQLLKAPSWLEFDNKVTQIVSLKRKLCAW